MKQRVLLFAYILFCSLSLSLVAQNEARAQSHLSQGLILPTNQEIVSTNARLPVLVSEGTLWTKVEYDEKTKTQRFFYRFTVDVDMQAINVAQEQGKNA